MNSNIYFVYAIESQLDFRIYVGFTDNIRRRINEHNDGLTKSTKGYRPWKLVYCERVTGRLMARQREKYLKSGYGKELLKKLLRSEPIQALDCSKSFKPENHLPYVIDIPDYLESDI